jgi:hypothetical protein
LYNIGDIIINRLAQKDDAIHHQPRKNIHLGYPHFTLFCNVRGHGSGQAIFFG